MPVFIAFAYGSGVALRFLPALEGRYAAGRLVITLRHYDVVVHAASLHLATTQPHV